MWAVPQRRSGALAERNNLVDAGGAQTMGGRCTGGGVAELCAARDHIATATGLAAD